MIVQEHQPFMTVTDVNPDITPYVYFKSDTNFLFPNLDINVVCPEIPLLVNTIESFFEDLELYLTADLTDEQNRKMLLERYEEIIIVTQRSAKTREEAFCYAITPLGSFYFDFFQRRGERLIETFTVFLDQDIKDGLFLVPCEVDFLPDGKVEVYHEYMPGMPFPPLRPEKYPEGSPQQENAKKYYEIQEAKYSSEASVYYVDDEDEPDMIDEVLAEGGGYWGEDDEEDDGDDWDDDHDDYVYDSVEDFLRRLEGGGNSRDFFQDDTLDTIYYVIRPED